MSDDIGLERVHNLRDIGGKPGHGDSVVRMQRLYRSGSPDAMTVADRDTLHGLGIVTMIDLRSRFEQDHRPYEWDHKVSAPIAHDKSVAAIFEQFQAGTLSSEQLEDWWSLTRIYDAPFDHLAALRRVFDTLLEAGDEGAVLYHCTGGKDRTGLVTALILEALGCPRHEIREDFLRTNTDVEDLMKRSEEFAAFVEKARKTGLTSDALFSLTGVKTEWLDKLFHAIERRHGTVTRYLEEAVGIGETGVERLRALYLE